MVHRDISAGNVLLSVDSNSSHEAFLIDLEPARIDDCQQPAALTELNKSILVQDPAEHRQISKNVTVFDTKTKFDRTKPGPGSIVSNVR